VDTTLIVSLVQTRNFNSTLKGYRQKEKHLPLKKNVDGAIAPSSLAISGRIVEEKTVSITTATPVIRKI